MYSNNRYAQQEQSNGDLENRRRYGVEDFAEEPVTKRSLRGLIRQMLTALTRPMDCAAKLASKICCEKG